MRQKRGKSGWVVFAFFAFLLLEAGCGGTGSGGGGGGGSTSSGGSGGTASSPSSMAVGDVVLVGMSGGQGSVSFSGAGGSYEVILQSQATSSGTNSFAVSSESAGGSKSAAVWGDPLEDAGLVEPEAEQVQLTLEQTLREEEIYLEGEGWPWDPPESYEESAQDSSLGKGVGVSKAEGDVSASVSAGDSDTFRVLSSLTDTTQYVEVTATAKCVNSEVVIFVDDEILSTNPSDFPDADINSLCSTYADQLPNLRSWFGGTPDINSDGVVVALVTPQVNRLGGSGGGITTGFFYSGDLFTRSGSIPASNEREIAYLRTPDSAGLYGTAVSNSFTMSNILPGVFPHEVQHLINYYQHTIVRSGSSEYTWLNEGLSHLAEDLVGYNLENYSRYDLFLASPQSYSLVNSTATLAQRGGAYLFLRYLYEQSGKSADFLKDMVSTANRGVDAIEGAYPSSGADFDQFEEFLQYWSVALAYTDRGLTSNGRYKYSARTTNGTTGNYEGVCMVCSAGDNRGTILSGPGYNTFSGSGSYGVRTSASRFLQFSSTPSSVDFVTSSSANPTAIVIRVE